MTTENKAASEDRFSSRNELPGADGSEEQGATDLRGFIQKDDYNGPRKLDQWLSNKDIG